MLLWILYAGIAQLRYPEAGLRMRQPEFYFVWKRAKKGNAGPQDGRYDGNTVLIDHPLPHKGMNDRSSTANPDGFSRLML